MANVKHLVWLLGWLLWGCGGNNAPQNYLKFELDGQMWESTEASAVLTQNNNLFALDITAQKTGSSEKIFLKIYSLSTKGVGVYQIAANEFHSITFAPTGAASGTANFRTDAVGCPPAGGNYMQVTDLSNGFASGIFEATVCNPNTGAVRQIRRGEFVQLRYPF